MFIQFGYVVLFSSAFPLAAMCALVNNVIEIRSDAFKLCTGLQRPFGQRVESIGQWQVGWGGRGKGGLAGVPAGRGLIPGSVALAEGDGGHGRPGHRGQLLPDRPVRAAPAPLPLAQPRGSHHLRGGAGGTGLVPAASCYCRVSRGGDEAASRLTQPRAPLPLPLHRRSLQTLRRNPRRLPAGSGCCQAMQWRGGGGGHARTPPGRYCRVSGVPRPSQGAFREGAAVPAGQGRGCSARTPVPPAALRPLPEVHHPSGHSRHPRLGGRGDGQAGVPAPRGLQGRRCRAGTLLGTQRGAGTTPLPSPVPVGCPRGVPGADGLPVDRSTSGRRSTTSSSSSGASGRRRRGSGTPSTRPARNASPAATRPSPRPPGRTRPTRRARAKGRAPGVPRTAPTSPSAPAPCWPPTT